MREYGTRAVSIRKQTRDTTLLTPAVDVNPTLATLAVGVLTNLTHFNSNSR